MSEIVKISIDDVLPNREAVMALQGIPQNKEPPENATQLFIEALGVFRKCVHPLGIIKDILYDDFHRVYEGQSLNAKDTPVPKIALQAEALALFAITLGRAVHDVINSLLGSRELALGSMLDSIASAGAETAADVVETRFAQSLLSRGGVDEKSVVMRYSPGYCGWHVSGQKKLFEYLQPGKIGIGLNDSCLMDPLKSVSGVLIAGRKEIHIIEDNYPFCRECETHSCQERMAVLLGRA
jgi:hypothetical protein